MRKTKNSQLLIENKNLLKFSKGNAKLSKDTLIFSLPAGKTCPGADLCHSFVSINKDNKRVIQDGLNTEFRCYAASQEVMYTALYKKRKYNLDLLIDALNDFKTIELINESLNKYLTNSIKKVRIHDSGDFFSGEYLRAWLAVAKLNPNIKFYCYSKSLNLFGSNVSIPKNFYLTASMGGKYDYLIHKGYFKRYAIVVNSINEAYSLGILHRNKPYVIDHDDRNCLKKEPFALLLHGTQPKGSKASKDLQLIKKELSK